MWAVRGFTGAEVLALKGPNPLFWLLRKAQICLSAFFQIHILAIENIGLKQIHWCHVDPIWSFKKIQSLLQWISL